MREIIHMYTQWVRLVEEELLTIEMQEKFENIKGEIRSRKLQKGRQYNGQNEKGQIVIHKTFH
jgi:hypothetical protein